MSSAILSPAGQDVFRLMVVGEAGLGKSTLVACLLQVKEHGAKLEIYQKGRRRGA